MHLVFCGAQFHKAAAQAAGAVLEVITTAAGGKAKGACLLACALFLGERLNQLPNGAQQRRLVLHVLQQAAAAEGLLHGDPP